MVTTNETLLPFSVRSQAYGSQSQAKMIIGTGSSKTTHEAPSSDPGIWFAVLNRNTLEVNLSIIHSDNTTVPAELKQYLTNDYILVVASNSLSMYSGLPQGDLFKFLDKYGSGRALRRMINIAEQFGCGEYGGMSYSMVNTLFESSEHGPAVGFEILDTKYASSSILTIQLKAVELSSGSSLWTPISLHN